MISTRKENFSVKRAVADELRRQNFISATALSNSHHTEIERMGIDSKKLVSSDTLRLVFANDPNTRAVCVDYGGKTSYWYHLDDLRLLYGFKSEKELLRVMEQLPAMPMSKQRATELLFHLNNAENKIGSAAGDLKEFAEKTGLGEKHPIFSHLYALVEHIQYLKDPKS